MRYQALKPVLTFSGRHRHLASMVTRIFPVEVGDAFPVKTLCGVIAVQDVPDASPFNMRGRLRYPDCGLCARLLRVAPRAPYPEWFKIWIS